MKKIHLFILIFFITINLFSQKSGKKIFGNVSYISSQFTYVKFTSTDGISINDTLYIGIKKSLVPKLIVKSKSSKSTACKIIGFKIKKGTKVTAFIKSKLVKDRKKKAKEKKIKLTKKNKKSQTIKNRFVKRKKNITGRFSLSGYSNLSNIKNYTDFQNWRYSFSLEANKINGSKFSFSNYFIFRYRADQWHLLSDNFSRSFKVYELAGKYEFNARTKLTIGRKINYKISNIGAIDGIQFETKINNFNLGVVVGSRPNFSDYGFNIKLFQTGIYASRDDSVGRGVMQNTLSVFQQMNNNTTDRRFLYFQHSNNIIKKVSFFFSSELDLFEKISGKNINSLRLTSLYFSTRYSPYRWLSLSASYDARKNVIYYETFKNYAYRLLDEALRQGFRLRINFRPINYVFASVYSGYRFRDKDIKPTRNFGASLTHSRIPYLKVSTSISYINLSTNYLNGDVLGFRLSKYFFNGILNTSLNYRNVNYKFNVSGKNLLQDIVSADLSIRFSRMFSFLISFEGTFKDKESYSNIYLNLTTRF